jgi:uncharacterized membrane protein YbhN (UPF0104 family)
MVVQGALLVATLAWAGYALAGQWGEFRTAATAANIQWGWIALASVIVLATYAMLVQSWRMLLAGWGGKLRFGAAVRIWTIANLGRYVPGKVWSIGALGVLARREGVSGVAAAGAAILGTLLNIGAGIGIMALSGARVLGVFKPWLQTIAVSMSVVFVLGTLALPVILPPVLARIAKWRGVPELTQHLPASTIWFSTAINAASWLGYGVAFAVFARGITPQVTASPPLFVVIWTASYVGGYLALYAPGGLGVRDAALTTGLVALGLATIGDATLLAVASRLWLTVLEILPGVVSLGIARLAAKSPSVHEDA